MRRNFDLSTVLVATGAIAVLVSLFLDWYSPGLRAWDVFEVVDWALLALAAGALVVLGTEATGAAAPSQRLAWIAGLAALLVVGEVIDPPPVARDAARETGAWLALAGVAAMVAGVVLALAQISVTIGVSERERRRRMTAVDARESRDAAAPERGADATAPAERGELWRRAATEDEPPARAARTAGDERTGAAGEEPQIGREPVDDPDRTQPLSPADRPSDEG